MALEAATYVSQLDPTLPTGSGANGTKSEGDNVLRLIKQTLVTTLPNLTGPVTATHTELNYVDGVTSAIQTQIDGKAGLASPTFTGTPAAPTAAVATSSTQLATTAFVQAALAAASTAPTAMVLNIVTGTSQTAVSGGHYVLTNVAATTVTLPASPTAGDTVWVTPGNGLTTNVIAQGGSKIMSLAEDMTLDNFNVTVQLRYINSTLGWRLV